MRNLHVTGTAAANILLASAWSAWSAATGRIAVSAFAPPISRTSSSSSSSSRPSLPASGSRTSCRRLPSDCFLLSRRRCRHPFALSSSNDENEAASGAETIDFESLGLSDDLSAVARRMNWEAPTPVQQLSVPAILEMAGGDGGSSLWCEGPTGSGKTGGFALPLLQIIMERKRYSSGVNYDGQGRVSTLILCPTRELAAQTGTVLQRLVSYLPANNKRNKKYYGDGGYDGDDDDDGAISIDVIYGGVPMEAQVARLAKRRKSGANVDVLVATPGRLVDVLRRSEHKDPTSSALERRILDAFDEKSEAKNDNRSGGRRRKKRGGGRDNKKGRRGGPSMESSLTLNEIQEMDLDRVDDDGRATLDEMLRDLDYLVVDEADRLLGGAFKDDVDELLALFPNNDGGDGASSEGTTNLKTLLFSATFPEQIEERVDRVLSRISAGVPLRVSTSAAMLQRVPSMTEGDDDGADERKLSNRQKKHLANTTPIKNVLPDAAPKIGHRVIRLDERDRTQALRSLLERNEDGAMDRVLVFVATRYATEHVSRKLRRYGITAADLHGKLDQDARERRLKAFRSGKTRALIATDLAARGIDVEGLEAVVNYDLPRSAEDFTHRTGRTGRAGRVGLAISFVGARSESHFDFIERKELRGERMEREVLPGFEPNEAKWGIESAASTASVPGATHSQRGLEHDRVFGGVKGRRKSKKDKLREAAAAADANPVE